MSSLRDPDQSEQLTPAAPGDVVAHVLPLSPARNQNGGTFPPLAAGGSTVDGERRSCICADVNEIWDFWQAKIAKPRSHGNLQKARGTSGATPIAQFAKVCWRESYRAPQLPWYTYMRMYDMFARQIVATCRTPQVPPNNHPVMLSCRTKRPAARVCPRSARCIAQTRDTCQTCFTASLMLRHNCRPFKPPRREVGCG